MKDLSIQHVSIREFCSSDLDDLISAGYLPWSVDELRSVYGRLKRKILDALQWSETRILVLHHRKQRKTIGTITLKKVNANLWGIWRIFIAPAFRGRGLAAQLYRTSFSYLKQRGARKAFGSVTVENIPSIKSIEKVWDGYLPQKYYYFYGLNPSAFYILKGDQDKIVIRNGSSRDKNALFKIYVECVCERWRKFLEINRSNFLGSQRILPGVPFLEGFLSFLPHKKVLIAESRNGKIEGYAVTKRRLTPAITPAQLYLFLAPTLTPEESLTVLKKIASFLYSKTLRKFEIFSINTNEQLMDDISATLENIGSCVARYLVCIKTLK